MNASESGTSPPSPANDPPRIVDQIFAQADGGRRQRWIVALGVTAGIYALLFGALPFLARPSLQERASALAARVHDQLGHEREIVLESPAPPPAPEPPSTSSPPVPHLAVAAPLSRTAGRTKSARARPPAAATAGAVVAVAGPVDFGATTFATGSSAHYAGGATTASGTNTHAVEGRAVDPDGARAAVAVSLDDADWSCPWPREADSADINEQVVILRVAVQPDGVVQTARILSDPGFGFGQAARLCALRTRFQPAQDPSGNRIFAWSSPLRVRFIR